MEKSRNIVGIDLFKLIAAILVLMIHTMGRDLGTGGYLFKRNICALAVPFFFISSGYFFANGLKNNNNPKEYFIKYEKKLIKSYIIWSIIGLPFITHAYISIYGSNYKYIFLLLIRNVFFTGTFGIYWYILSMIGASILIYYFISRNKEKLMYVLSISFFLIGVLYSGFQNYFSSNIIFNIIFKIIYVIFSCERNFLMVGWFYMVIGYYIYNKDIKIKLSTLIILFLFSTLLKFSETSLVNIQLFEINRIMEDNELIIFQLFQAVFFFLIALNLNLDCLNTYSKSMRELSSFIYYTHFLFVYIIDPCQQGNTILTTLIVLILCILLYSIIKKINIKQLNILINA